MRYIPESEKMLASSLAKALIRRRQQLGLTQEEVAFAAGIDRRTYQDLEHARSDHKTNRPANPRLHTLVRISKVLRCDIQELIAGPMLDYHRAEALYGETIYRKY